MGPEMIVPEWPAPACVKAFSTTRNGGFSVAPWDTFNLGLNCGDDPRRVARNRQLLRGLVPAEPVWLRQVHGTAVLDSDDYLVTPGENAWPEADAQWSTRPGTVLSVLTADCLPVLLCRDDGTAVAVAHAGWRGLASGVLEASVRALGSPPERMLAWLGPAIGPQTYEVGADVLESFGPDAHQVRDAFIPQGDRWLMNLYELARFRLRRLGISRISGGGFCTYSDAGRFFSFRRDGMTGRMATLIWIQP